MSYFSLLSSKLERINTIFRVDDSRSHSTDTSREPVLSKQTAAEKHAEQEHASGQAIKGRTRFLHSLGLKTTKKEEKKSVASHMSPNFPGMAAATEKRVKKIAPELYDQLMRLREAGWRFEERQLENGPGQFPHRCIVIDPRIAERKMGVNKKGTYVHLCALAHQVGCALDRQNPDRPGISAATRDEYVRDSLQHAAAGILNECYIRMRILQRTTGKKDIWSGRSEAYKALADIHKMPSSATDRRQAIAEALGTISAPNGKTYANILERQYDLFQISDKTSENVAKFVKNCFNETGIALPADQIKAHGRRPDGRYYWMAQEGLTTIMNDHKSGFIGKGFREQEIGSAVMTAISKGTKWKSKQGSKSNFYTYHDPQKNCVYGIFVKFGERPGEIVNAKIHDPVGFYAIHSQDGSRYSFLDIKNIKNILTPSHEKAFANQGVPAVEIPDVVMTAMAAGRRTPEQDTDDDYQAYRFRYKNLPNELVLHAKQEPSGEIKDFKLAAMQNNATAAPKQKTATDAILAGSEGEILRRQASELGIDAGELLSAVIKKDNERRFSFEHPDFGVYRADFNGQHVTLLAKVEQGRIVKVKEASALDRLFANFPLQEKRCAQLQKQGWNLRVGSAGGGTYCMRHTNEIVIDPTAATDKFAGIRILAHEMAHALYNPRDVDKDTDYITERKMDEGNSLLSEYKLIDEATDEEAREGIIRHLREKSFFEEALDIYSTWKQDFASASDGLARSKVDEIARKGLGDIYRRLKGSTFPTGSNYEMSWLIDYRSRHGNDSALTLMNELLRQEPEIQIMDMSGDSAPPSFDNVQIIHRLPKKSGIEKPKIIFIDKNTFVRQIKGMDPQEIETVITNALTFASLSNGPKSSSIKVIPSPNGSNLQRAKCSYMKNGARYIVHLDFDETGRVYSLNLVLPENRENLPSPRTPARQRMNISSTG